MSFALVIALFLLGNWLFNKIFILFPFGLFALLQTLSVLGLGVLGLGIFAWIFGDEGEPRG